MRELAEGAPMVLPIDEVEYFSRPLLALTDILSKVRASSGKLKFLSERMCDVSGTVENRYLS